MSAISKTYAAQHDGIGSQAHTKEWQEFVELVISAVRIAMREEFLGQENCERADLVTTEQAAMLLQRCPTAFEKARSLGRGPLAEIPYVKIGRSVRYARADILAAVARFKVPGRAPKA